MTPKVTPDALKEAKDKIELIKKRIQDKEITFAEAARTMSDEKETRANGGTLINPKTQDTHFELTKMDPELYAQVSNMKSGTISNVILDEDPKAGKRYKIIMVTNKIEDHVADFSKDYTKIKELALKEKQIDAIAKWSEKKIKETYIKINGEYKDCTFTNNWLKNSFIIENSFKTNLLFHYNNLLIQRTKMSDVTAIQNLVQKRIELKKEISKIIIGQDDVVDQILLSIFSGGHALLVGVPGLAKTLMVNTIAQALGLDFKRIQFTPDLMPSDILGSEILDESRNFKFIKGPIFSNIILADEINRTPPKHKRLYLKPCRNAR